MNNTLPLCSFEQSTRLKGAGFDWPTYEYTLNKSNFHGIGIRNWNSINKKHTSCPTLEHARMWMREVKKLEIIVESVTRTHRKKYIYAVWEDNVRVDDCEDICYDTYDLALSAGIDEALTIIETQNK